MNYREFTERVYNYKHGLTKSAESQNIEHSTKENGEVVGNAENTEHIAHYELGQEADPSKRKYIDKIYLGEGKYRYIYEDGTSSTGYNPVPYDNPGRQSQRAKPLVDNFNGRQATKEQASGISEYLKSNVQSPSNEAFVQGRNASYQEDVRKAAGEHRSIPTEQERLEIAKQEGEKRAASGTPSGNGAPSLLQSEVDTLVRKGLAAGENKKKEIEEGKKMEALYGGTGGGSQNVGSAFNKTAPDNMKGNTAESIVSPNFAEGLKATGAKWTPDIQGTPLDKLNAQSVQTTRDQQAKNILTEYENAIVYDVLEPLRKAGFEDDWIWKVIDDMEISQTGEGITSYLKDHLDQFSNLTFFPGAEEGLKVYSEKVLPVLKSSVQSTIEEKEEEDFYNSLTPEQKVIFDRTVQKNKQS